MNLGKENIINLQIIYTYFKCNISNQQHNTSVKYHIYNLTMYVQHRTRAEPCSLDCDGMCSEPGMWLSETTPPLVGVVRPEVGIRNTDSRHHLRCTNLLAQRQFQLKTASPNLRSRYAL